MSCVHQPELRCLYEGSETYRLMGILRVVSFMRDGEIPGRLDSWIADSTYFVCWNVFSLSEGILAWVTHAAIPYTDQQCAAFCCDGSNIVQRS
jgi:hypothetical protein